MSSQFNEALAEANLADYNYLTKLEQISNQARSIRGKDLTLKRPLTEEMVKEYQKQFNTPVVVEEHDEFGNPVTKQYKYAKPSMADTLEEYNPVEPDLSPDDIQFINKDLHSKMRFIETFAPLFSETEKEVNEIISQNKNRINEIDEERSQLTAEYNSIVITRSAPRRTRNH
jgi:predicted  nucleic acid-binding Zn-ribbon protein